MKANVLLQQLQEAIDEATPGQLIELPEGTLAGTLVIDKPLHLKGQGAEKTILDGQGEQAAVVVEASEGVVELEGVAITRGVSNEGGGLQIFNGAHLKLRHCQLRRNAAEGGIGGGVSIADGVLEASHCQWHQNSAERGGAVFCAGNSEATFHQCDFTQNKAASGGALACIDGATLSAQRCSFQGNEASGQGAHIHLQGTTSAAPALDLQSCEFAYTEEGNDFFNDKNAPAHVTIEDTLMPAHLQRLLRRETEG